MEAAVYFSVLEALQNVAKYAEASSVVISLSADDDSVRFEVHDDGVGFDPSNTGYGTGLQGISDRLSALGGSMRVESAPGAGTTVAGSVPGLVAVPGSAVDAAPPPPPPPPSVVPEEVRTGGSR
ncbi:MAG: sensor histidine kinase [Actinomycetota bacterium]